MNQIRDITIYEVAKRAQVSTATVSRALSKTCQVSKNTKRKVLQAADELGYRTNYFARSLRSNQTNTIGVIVREWRSNFVTSVLTGIEKVTTAAGYDLLIVHSSENLQKEHANVKRLYDKRVDGLIASLSFETKNLDHFKLFVEKKIPLVFFDRLEEVDTNSVVMIDNYKSGYIATKHLIQQGCTTIAHVTSSLERNIHGERCRGYIDALKDSNMRLDSNMIIISDLREESAINAANQLIALNPVPDGVFISDDFIAAVIMKALKKHDFKIPDDIAIVGFNNDTISQLVEPSLTTVSYPGEDVGGIAATLLLSYLKGNDSIEVPRKVVVDSGLIVRGSSHRTNFIGLAPD